MPDQITQEVRFAVVMYGGVSLAIYINGAAQELLSAVRSTAALPSGQALTATEKVYRKLGQILHHGRLPDASRDDYPAEQDPVRSRILVDILSGTSAGGINAVFLAKALAQGGTDLSGLRELWLEKADMDKLLNDDDAKSNEYPPASKKTSLLNNNYMYGTLLDAFRAMNAGKTPLVDPVDLFTTTTDLHGINVPIQLTGARVNEKMHKMVFHFELDGERKNDFTAQHDPMLAFASRCTSSFPVAFEPMRALNIEMSGVNFGANEKNFEPFFKRYEQFAKGKDWTRRPFADGGYLDNKPFSHAIEAIPHRDSAFPYLRKLLFVDPFPESELDGNGTNEVNFLDNALLAATELPTYETIRGDIERIDRHNTVQSRTRNLRKRVEETRVKRAVEAPARSYDQADLPEMIQAYGAAYALYHHIRVFRLTDWLADIGTKIGGMYEGGAAQLGFVYLLRVWRDAHFSSERKASIKTENQYLYEFDIDFRIRRAHFMRKRIDEVTVAPVGPELLKKIQERGRDKLAAIDPPLNAVQVAKELADRREKLRVCLNSLREKRRDIGDLSDSPLAKLFKGPRATALREALPEIVKPLSDFERYKAAERAQTTHGPILAEFCAALSSEMEPLLKETSTTIKSTFVTAPVGEHKREAAAVNDWLRFQYLDFTEYDMVTLPVLDGTDVADFTRVQIFRISPVDSMLKPDSEKLAGLKLGHFGAFLSEDWRSNDMAWGRLDAAERIIFACLPDERDTVLRNRLIGEIQDVILEEEFSLERSNRITNWVHQKLRDPLAEKAITKDLVNQVAAVLPAPGTSLRGFVQNLYTVPPPPAPRQALSWMGRATNIVGRMFENIDVPSGSRIRFFGSLAVFGVKISVPGIPATIAVWTLRLMVAASILLIVLAGMVSNQGVSKVGYIGLAIAVLGMVVRVLLSLWLTGQKRVLKALKTAVIVVVFAFFALGAWTAFGWLRPHWPF